MAEGGTPSSEELTCYLENFQEQSDEIEALCSIFEADQDRIQILSRAYLDGAEGNIEEFSSNMLKIYIPIDVGDNHIHIDVYLPPESEQTFYDRRSEGTKISLARSESGQRVIWSFDAKYLPPICLQVTLPQTYPSHDSPSFVISCSWLSPHQLSALCRELDGLWYDNKTCDMPGMPILYTWVDWIQESCLSFLGIKDHLSVTAHTIDIDIDDSRVSIETEDLNLIVTSIVRYNHEQEVWEFFRQDHECEICFDRLPGDKFYLLLECNHHVCKNCMKAHCELLVNEGTVQNLRCPSYKCTSAIPPYILQDVLTDEQFKRYDKLALQKALDIMGDIIYCPRCNSAVIREPEQDLNLAHCMTCIYSFCTECEEAWHQGEMCKTDLEELQSQKEMTAKKKEDEENVEEVERLRIMHKQENRQSKKYIKDMSKPCPRCNSNIMKVAGCNFVHCSVCRTGMCWVCGQEITSYGHFADNPKCNTFEVVDKMIDNTDMRLVNLMNAPVLIPRPPPVKKAKNEGNVIEERLKIHPDLMKNIMRCLTCKQKNEKKTENNQIRCWNCSAQQCFACRQKITGAVGRHFTGVNSCPQHSKLEYLLKKESER